MDWEVKEEDPMLAHTTVDISESSDNSSSDGGQGEEWPPWCQVPARDNLETPSYESFPSPDIPEFTPPPPQTENGVLSFENPNYTLSGNLADALNRNTDGVSNQDSLTDNQLELDGGLSALDSLYSELDHVCNLTRTHSVVNRRQYARLDAGSMGVDLTTGPITNLDKADHQNNSTDKHINGTGLGNKKINEVNSINNTEKADQEINIPHMTPENSQDLYALPMKKHQAEVSDDSEEKNDSPDESLPYGWEKHEDNNGPYYWHIKSGTITRTPPAMTPQGQAPLRQKNKENELPSSVTRSSTSSALSELVETRPRGAVVDNAYKRRSYPVRSDFVEPGSNRPIRFAVRSLGWVEIAEEDLTPERSSKAVNKCIVELSVGGRRDLLDVVGQWGEGKDLFMDLDEGSLKLVDPENLTVLNTQPIHTIRVWGVGRDNGRERDFAYVARDRITRKHMCHVFRCDSPARTIANTLRDICKKIMIERSLQQTLMSKPLDTVATAGAVTNRTARPTNLPTEQRRLHRHSQLLPAQSFPTPMEEPKKVIRARYLGVIEVSQASGMEVLNGAIATASQRSSESYKNVSVAVAPSTITITNLDDGRQLAECRVRFLSFLGIGPDVKQCAFIMHTAQDQFFAHVFHCEPSSGALCKTIEAACKLRYQKCLDAHPGSAARGVGVVSPKTISATIKSMFTTFTGRKGRPSES